MSDITGRKDILFLFDAENCNPNGDILNGNAPRMDDETGKGETSDVRMKRYIRDQHIREGYDGEVFIREYSLTDDEVAQLKSAAKLRGFDVGKIESGNVATIAQAAALNNIDPQKTPSEVATQAQKFFDLRLFGSVLPLVVGDGTKKKAAKKEGARTVSINFSGPVQFQMGQTLHRISTEFIKGTGAGASEEGKDAKTFREETFVKYGLYTVNGAIDRYNAKKTGMSEEDAQAMYRLLWQGLKQSASRSKFGQMPQLLLVVSYKGDDFIGRLHHKVQLESDLSDEKIRSLNDYTLDFSLLTEALKNNASKIEKIEFLISDELKVRLGGTLPLQEWKELKA